jgi:hypothetical protein
MGDIYSRVYHLPARLKNARDKARTIQRRIDWLGKDARWQDHQSLMHANTRLRSLENEARQYHFWDLLVDTDEP